MNPIKREELPLRLLPKTTSNGELAFPWKLHVVLEESEKYGFQGIISWQGNKAFKVHDQDRFENCVMNKYFNNTQYKTFQRQLNIYAFQRVTRGKYVGSYTHEFICRGNPDICRFMTRTKVKKKGARSNNKKTNAIEKGHIPYEGNRVPPFIAFPSNLDLTPKTSGVSNSYGSGLVSSADFSSSIEPISVEYDSLDGYTSSEANPVPPQTMSFGCHHMQNPPDIVPCDQNYGDSVLNRTPVKSESPCGFYAVRSKTLSVMNKVVDSGNMVFDNSSFAGPSLSPDQQQDLRQEQCHLMEKLAQLLQKQQQFMQQQNGHYQDGSLTDRWHHQRDPQKTYHSCDKSDGELNLESIFEEDDIHYDCENRNSCNMFFRTAEIGPCFGNNHVRSNRMRRFSLDVLTNVFDD